MYFCIATVAFWRSVGFDTTYWRTSTDGLKAICHAKFAQTLVDIEGHEKVETFPDDSQVFKDRLATEFTSER